MLEVVQTGVETAPDDILRHIMATFLYSLPNA